MIIFDWIEENLDVQGIGVLVSALTIIACAVFAYKAGL
jgi:hypothetical protein